MPEPLQIDFFQMLAKVFLQIACTTSTISQHTWQDVLFVTWNLWTSRLFCVMFLQLRLLDMHSPYQSMSQWDWGWCYGERCRKEVHFLQGVRLNFQLEMSWFGSGQLWSLVLLLLENIARTWFMTYSLIGDRVTEDGEMCMTVVGHDLKAATLSCGSVKNVMPQTAQNIWFLRGKASRKR